MTLGETVGAGDPAAAQRRQAEDVRERAQADRVRDDALRDDDGRHSLASLQTAHGHGRRPDPAARQEGRPRRHPRVHPLPPSPQKGYLTFIINIVLSAHFHRQRLILFPFWFFYS